MPSLFAFIACFTLVLFQMIYLSAHTSKGENKPVLKRIKAYCPTMQKHSAEAQNIAKEIGIGKGRKSRGLADRRTMSLDRRHDVAYKAIRRAQSGGTFLSRSCR